MTVFLPITTLCAICTRLSILYALLDPRRPNGRGQQLCSRRSRRRRRFGQFRAAEFFVAAIGHFESKAVSSDNSAAVDDHARFQSGFARELSHSGKCDTRTDDRLVSDVATRAMIVSSPIFAPGSMTASG